MAGHDYPFRLAHGRQHELQLEAVDKLSEEILSGDQPAAALRFRIQCHLVDRYINHTTRSDYHLGHFLNRRGVS